MLDPCSFKKSQKIDSEANPEETGAFTLYLEKNIYKNKLKVLNAFLEVFGMGLCDCIHSAVLDLEKKK